MSRFTTPFGFHSTAAEVIAGVDLAGKRAIITGGAAGIGIETARALSSAGAAVTLAVRRPDAAEARLYFEDCNQAQQVTRRPTDFTGGMQLTRSIPVTPNAYGTCPSS